VYGEDEAIWQQLNWLASSGIIELEMTSRSRHPGTPWEDCKRVVACSESEPLLRSSLKRPDPHLVRQAHAEQVGAHAVFARPELLTPQSVPERLSTDRWLKGLSAIPELVARAREDGIRLTAYQISARVFSGQSKYLADREDWLENLFGWSLGTIVRRPLILNLSLPEADVHSILFIENKDTYRYLCDQRPRFHLEHSALVYSEGFMSSAERITEAESVRWHLDMTRLLPSPDVIQAVMAQWQTPTLPIYFFGDLDWSGAQILKTLKQRYPQLAAWKPGYQALLSYASQVGGHAEEESGKGGQRRVEQTGDDWFDAHVLAPLIAGDIRLVDQEVILTL
jgi:hypothetical protein